MKNLNEVDFGSIKIHKKVLAEIICLAVEKIEGVQFCPRTFIDELLELAGIARYPGIDINVDKNNQANIDVKVSVCEGVNIPEVASSVQDAIRAALEKTVDIDLKDVNVNILGIQRAEGEKA